MNGVRAVRSWRIFNVVTLAFNLLLLTLNAVSGNILAVVNAAAVAILVAAVYVNTRTIHRIQERDRPRPDYAAIAAMERDIWGRTFEHAGAPEGDPVAGFHAMMDGLAERGTKCRMCAHGHPFLGGICAECARQRKRGGIDAEVARLHAEGLSSAQIAERYGIRAGTVRATATRNRAPDFGERRSNLRWERPS